MMRSSSYVVLDVETTGLRPGRHGLTELFAARTDGFGEVKSSFHSLINPGHPIPSFISRLTGITDGMVKDAPLPREALARFSRFLSDSDVLVGHNFRFDAGFLEHERQRAGLPSFPSSSLCTLLLARRVFAPKPLSSYRLGMLAQALGIPVVGAHRAEQDVRMTIGVQQSLFNMLERRGVREAGDVLRLQRLPLAEASRLFS